MSLIPSWKYPMLNISKQVQNKNLPYWKVSEDIKFLFKTFPLI